MKFKNSTQGHGYVFNFWTFTILTIPFMIFFLCTNCSDAKKDFPVKRYKRVLTVDSNSTVDLKPLLSFISRTKVAELSEIRQILAPYKELTETSPIWPIYTFLSGEVYRLQKDVGKAREFYWALTEWAFNDPYEDGWGGSGLVCLALWRWLQTINMYNKLDYDEGVHIIDIAERLMETRLICGMFSSPIFSGLPQIEEDIWRRLAILSWSVGDKDRAQRFFLNYLKVASTAELGDVETKLKDLVLSSGSASRDRLTLWRGKRLYTLKMYNDAFELLSEARNSMNQQVKAEADFYLANIKRINGEPHVEIVKLLTSVIENVTDPNIAQEALFLRAILYNREGNDRNVNKFLEDLSNLIENFPRGHRADDALYEIARHYQINGSAEKALQYFARLRNFKGRNDWINLAHFQPAILLYTRAKAGDLKKAAELLLRLNKQNPSGPLHLAALFWLGRIAEESSDMDTAESYFQSIIQESPYDYYSIRARMHLHMNESTSKQLMPDGETTKELQSAYFNSKVDCSVSGDSPYHFRLNHSIKTGLYSNILVEVREKTKLFPCKRLERLSIKDLDNLNIVVSTGLLLSMRQDALAAKDVLSNTKNRLQIAAAVGYDAGDWPLSVNLTMAYDENYEIRWTSQKNESYLATAYPLKIFNESIAKTSIARNVPFELLYSIIRRESNFYPEAISERNALGLFQFTPFTFKVLDKQWKLLESSGVDSLFTFLLDPNLNIDLGARTLKDELLKRYHGDILLALMAHNAGLPAVENWISKWKELGRSNDIEYMIETIRFEQTRIFIRGVITDMAIVYAARASNAKQRKRRFGYE